MQTKYNTPVSQAFIRRKLGIFLFKQKYPDAAQVGDNYIEETIDHKIYSLKKKDEGTNVSRTDEIYIECLIRSNFNESDALRMLRNNRPNLVHFVSFCLFC